MPNSFMHHITINGTNFELQDKEARYNIDTYAITKTRNLINVRNIKKALYNTSKQEYVNNDVWRATDPIPVEPGAQYTFSYNSNSSGESTLSHYYVLDEDMNLLGSATKVGGLITIPSEFDTAYYLILDTNNQATVANALTWQLEQGNISTGYINYYQSVLDSRLVQKTGSSEEDVMSQNAISSIVDNFVWVKSNNLINEIKNGYLYDTNKSGFIVSSNWVSTGYVDVEEGETYKFSVNYGTLNGVANKICGINDNFQFVEQISSSSGVFTVPEGNGITMVVVSSNNERTKQYINTWQIEKGSVNTRYQPYYIEKYKVETDWTPTYVTDEINRVFNELYVKLNNGNIATFGFNTDQHITVGDYSQISVGRGLKALAKLTEMIPFDFVCLGGDDCGYKTDDTTVNGIVKDVCYVAEAISTAKCPIFNITGNHDAYQNNNEIKSESLFNLKGKKTVINKWNSNESDLLTTNFVFDDSTSKIRFIFFDTNYYNDEYKGRPDYSNFAATEFLSEALSETPSSYKIIVLSHFALNSGLGSDFISPKAFESIIEPYASRIICCINGHAHKDGAETLNSILYIQTTTAGISAISDTYNRVLGTATETAFDVFMIDQSNLKVYVFRYGAGGENANREFTYTVG